MTRVLMTIVGGLSLAASATSPTYPFAGSFSFPHAVAVMGYATKAACEADKGEWVDEGICSFQSEDSVTVLPGENGQFDVAVETVATNAHMCSFEGSARAEAPGRLVATADGDEWNDAKGDFEKATCELTVTYKNSANSVSVSTNGKCRSFCGARAVLAIENATRR